MASFSSTVSITPATGQNPVSPTMNMPATNPGVIVHVALKSATADVSSITTSSGLGSISGVKIAERRTSDCYVTTWKITAPTASGSGTATVNLSASVPYQIFFEVFSDCDQSDLSPNGDAVTDTDPSAYSSKTLTPTNLGASDCACGASANTIGGNPSGVTPNQRYLSSSTGVNLQGGDATGTTGVTLSGDNGSPANCSYIAVRVANAVGPSISSVDGDNDTVDTRSSVPVAGSSFGPNQGTGKVEVSNNATYGLGTVTEITVQTWTASNINVTMQRASDSAALSSIYSLPATLYLWVTRDDAVRNSTGKQFTLQLPGATWVAAADTPANLQVDINYRVRVRLENGSASPGAGFKWQRKRNTGAWADIMTTSSVVKAIASSHFADGDDTIELIGGAGTFKTNNDSADETGAFTLPTALTAGESIEPELAFQIVGADVANGDSISFRIVLSDGSTLDTYSVTPSVTVVGAILGIASESDSAITAISIVKTQINGVAIETDSASAPPSAKLKSIGICNSADSALLVNPVSQSALAIALESESSFGLSRFKRHDVGLASEAAITLGARAIRFYDVGIAADAEAAQAVARAKQFLTGLAQTLDTAFIASIGGGVGTVRLATESDSAQPAQPLRHYDLAQLFEGDSALAAILTRRVRLGVGTDTENASVVAHALSYVIAAAIENDSALAFPSGAPSVPGLEFSSPISRLHFVAPISRLHYTAPEEDR
jgi:hypothetical protein